MSKPVIGMVAHHCCIRVYKEARVLIDLGYEVHLVTNRINFGVEEYETVSYFNSVKQIHQALRHRANVDIWHVHNEPDWLVEQTLAGALPHQAVVFDVHDFESARWATTPFQEQKIMKLADGCVHVSEPMKALALEIYGVNHPSCVVLPCHVPKSWYVEPTSKFYNNVVYEGGLDTPYKPPRDGLRGQEVSFRDYGLLFDGIVRAGYGMTAYPSNITDPGIEDSYAKLGIWVRPQINYPDLMTTLAQYSWGVVGASAKSLLMDRAMPNKLFEYMAAGAPVIVFNADTAAQFVEQLGIGFVIPPIDGDREAIHNHISRTLENEATPDKWRAYRAQVLAVRDAWSMDAQIGPLCELYDMLLSEVKANGTRRVRATAGQAAKSQAG